MVVVHLTLDEDLKAAIQRTEFIQKTYTHVKMKQVAQNWVKVFTQLPASNENDNNKQQKKVILGEQLPEKDTLAQTYGKVSPKKLKMRGVTEGDHSDKGSAQDLLNHNVFSGLKNIGNATQKLTDPKSDHTTEPEFIMPVDNDKVIEIDVFLDSPVRTPSLECAPVKFPFRSIRSDGHELSIKNCITGEDVRTMYKVLVAYYLTCRAANTKIYCNRYTDDS